MKKSELLTLRYNSFSKSALESGSWQRQYVSKIEGVKRVAEIVYKEGNERIKNI